MLNQSIVELLDMSGQVVLITGASRGIGRAMAEVFAQTGAKLALVARTAGPLQAAAARLRNMHPMRQQAKTGLETVLALPADVADPTQVDQVVGQIVETWGQVDVLINNAGLMQAGPLDQIDLAAWERLLAANLTGAYLCSRAVAPLMQRQKGGRIINIASITAQTGGVSGGVHYSASKGGLLAMTKTLARDLAPFGITVNAIAPGQIETDPGHLTPEARQYLETIIPLGRLGRPEEIAYAALFLASPMAAYITGATLDVNGGLLKR
jgi:3-oxoacyl-[acyl-carrier protein] reductase